MSEKAVNPELAEVTDDIRKSIIEQYYKQPVLWDREKTDRQNAPAAWEFIASAVSTRVKTFNVKIVKIVMKNLRDQFVRVHRKALQEGSDTIHWKFYEDLLFLADNIPPPRQPLQAIENSQETPVTSNGILSNFVSSISSAFNRQPACTGTSFIKEEDEGDLTIDEESQAQPESFSPGSVTGMVYEAAQNRIECKEEEKPALACPPQPQLQYPNYGPPSHVHNNYYEVPGVFTQSTPVKQASLPGVDMRPVFNPGPKQEVFSGPIGNVQRQSSLAECLCDAISPQNFDEPLGNATFFSPDVRKRSAESVPEASVLPPPAKVSRNDKQEEEAGPSHTVKSTDPLANASMISVVDTPNKSETMSAKKSVPASKRKESNRPSTTKPSENSQRKPTTQFKSEADTQMMVTMQEQCLKTLGLLESQSGLGLMVAEVVRKLDTEHKDKCLEFKRAVRHLVDTYEQIIYH